MPKIIPNEVWAPIGDYKYEVSNMGRVRRSFCYRRRPRFRKPRILNPTKAVMGYGVFLYHPDLRPKKWFKVEDLVGNTFLPGKGKLEHVDGDECNNKLSNLRRKGRKRNQKVPPETVCAILAELEERNDEFGAQKKIAKKYGITPRMVRYFKAAATNNS